MKFKTKPFAHQMKAFDLSKKRKGFALLMEQGTGKTKVIIDTAAYLYENKAIDTVIVICPNGVHRNWVNNEIPIHMSCEYRATFYSSQMKKKQIDKFNEVLEYDGLKIFAFNVEAFTSVTAQKYMMTALKNNKVLMVIDESSRIKTPSSKRTKMITKFGKHPNVIAKRILTGTPVTKGAEDVFAQFKFLNPDILEVTSLYKFKDKYCVMGGFKNKQIVGYQIWMN